MRILQTGMPAHPRPLRLAQGGSITTRRQFLGTTPLAAIALVFPLVMLMQMLSAGAMGGGVSSAISRALGAGDLARAEVLAFHAVVIGAAAGLFFSAIFVAFGAPILAALGGAGDVLGQALGYANIALTGAILTWVLNTFASVLRGTGNMRVPSLTLLAASGAGRYKSVTEACQAAIKVVSSADPRAEAKRAYGKSYPMYQKLYQSLKADFAEMAKIVEDI